MFVGYGFQFEGKVIYPSGQISITSRVLDERRRSRLILPVLRFRASTANGQEVSARRSHLLATGRPVLMKPLASSATQPLSHGVFGSAPGELVSATRTSSPSEPPYIAAASPEGPAPMMTTSRTCFCSIASLNPRQSAICRSLGSGSTTWPGQITRGILLTSIRKPPGCLSYAACPESIHYYYKHSGIS